MHGISSPLTCSKPSLVLSTHAMGIHVSTTSSAWSLDLLMQCSSMSPLSAMAFALLGMLALAAINAIAACWESERDCQLQALHTTATKLHLLPLEATELQTCGVQAHKEQPRWMRGWPQYSLKSDTMVYDQSFCRMRIPTNNEGSYFLSRFEAKIGRGGCNGPQSTSTERKKQKDNLDRGRDTPPPPLKIEGWACKNPAAGGFKIYPLPPSPPLKLFSGQK